MASMRRGASCTAESVFARAAPSPLRHHAALLLEDRIDCTGVVGDKGLERMRLVRRDESGSDAVEEHLLDLRP